MIKFFRQIRYDLMGKNKTGKYFKYAIGEIILVVIGILIALQINNWNEAKKASNKEQNLFRNLKVDFEARLKELKEFNISREVAIDAILEINKIIANSESRPNDSIIDKLISRTLNGFKFNEEFKMLEVIFNTGLINDIKNESLKRQLIEWPQKVEEMLEEQRMINDIIDNKHLPHLKKYISLRDIYEKFDFRKYNLPKGEPVTLNKNYEELLVDPVFENNLVLMQMLINVNYIDTKTLIASAEKIISLLNNELH
mgnify:CR=1 FL=1